MLISLQTVRKNLLQQTSLNVHKQAAHLKAIGMKDVFPRINESGSIFLEWIKHCRITYQTRKECLFFYVIQLNFEKSQRNSLEFIGSKLPSFS